MAQKILIVEQDSGVKDVLELILQMSGYEVDSIKSSDLAHCISSSKPDLLILDLWQLDDQQVHLLKHLRRKHTLPVLGTTTDNRIDEKAKTVIDGRLGKPFDIDVLQKRVQVLLRQD